MVILAVDDKPINNQVIALDLEEYFEEKDMEFNFLNFDNGVQCLDYINKNPVDIIFMDYMMPKLSGVEVVEKIRSMNVKQPKIVMVTALNSQSHIIESFQAGANFFIAKPYCNREIANAMDMIFYDNRTNVVIRPSDLVDNNEFMDFDDDFGDQFIDFDEDSEIENQKEMMKNFNQSHKMLSAVEFLSEYHGLEVGDYVDDLNFIENSIYSCIDELDGDNISMKLLDIIDALGLYARFFNNFTEFMEISIALQLLQRVLNNTPFYELESKKRTFVSNYIVAILTDLVDWKNHVFVDKDAVDVFYINASLLNSCIQLESILKTKGIGI